MSSSSRSTQTGFSLNNPTRRRRRSEDSVTNAPRLARVIAFNPLANVPLQVPNAFALENAPMQVPNAPLQPPPPMGRVQLQPGLNRIQGNQIQFQTRNMHLPLIPRQPPPPPPPPSPPAMAKGGKAKKTGKYMLHKGEIVVPARTVKTVDKALKKAGMKPLNKTKK